MDTVDDQASRMVETMTNINSKDEADVKPISIEETKSILGATGAREIIAELRAKNEQLTDERDGFKAEVQELLDARREKQELSEAVGAAKVFIAAYEENDKLKAEVEQLKVKNETYEQLLKLCTCGCSEVHHWCGKGFCATCACKAFSTQEIKMTDLRVNEEPELLKEMLAHSGECKYCGTNGLVKMVRDKDTFRLKPDQCYCVVCGQRYYMEIADLDAWELKQWQQKTAH